MKMGEDGIEATKKMFAVRFEFKFELFALISTQTLGIGL